MYSNDYTADFLTKKTGNQVIALKNKTLFRFGQYGIVTFDVPHEDIPNSAYIIIYEDGTKLFYSTDFEYIPFTVKTWNINHFLIAVNHSEEIPPDDEAREHRLRGHSSLEVVKDFLKASMTDACKTVTACHLSGKYADAERIERELREVCGENVAVNIARKGMRINL